MVNLSYIYRKKRLQMHFERYSGITQYAKLAAEEQFCRRCSHRNYSTSKPLKVPPEKIKVLSSDVTNEQCLLPHIHMLYNPLSEP